MRVAIAGSGSVARYFAEELPAAGLDVVILTRSIKPEFENLPGVRQFVTDYSVSSLLEGIEGSSTLISAILGYTSAFIDVHRSLIEAAKKSSTCKRFIPAEYGGNLEDFPDQPAFYSRLQGVVRKELAEQDELEWTLLSTGWFVDYVVPRRNRMLQDAGDAIPVNIAGDSMLIPGSGKELLDLTSVRDMARAVAKLVQAPRWERYTYLSGEKSTWNDIAVLVQAEYPQVTVRHRSLAQLIEDIVAHPDGEERIVAEYGVFSASGAGSLPVDKVAAHREKYFAGIKFRTARDLMAEVERDPDVIV
ncbi:Putative NmrA-like domain, NAD(P)-binding domain superfamily [Colletotrichum destructivum]|uniref:NmrA-like domain, NAD(P)-binding domain superfamily n=1 Tax=Colletotrichum destructivum TaxID=34406 RepID=A0AAX4INJ2_9PEZI|nr:Putative NmrA-like domain, NAD(P)-binding domain superfamily [Colletotrichum destructivum]